MQTNNKPNISTDMEKVQKFNAKVRTSLKRPDLKAGDIVKIHRKIKEGEKERVQVFEGIVIGVKGKQSSSPTATVRRVSFGTGVEITVPLHSPAISKIEIVKQAKVHQAKLYYLRGKGVRISKLKTKELAKFVAEPARIATQSVAGGEVKEPEAEAVVELKAEIAENAENKE
jgi:large subunit ribosomal protein L19